MNMRYYAGKRREIREGRAHYPWPRMMGAIKEMFDDLGENEALIITKGAANMKSISPDEPHIPFRAVILTDVSVATRTDFF